MILVHPILLIFKFIVRLVLTIFKIIGKGMLIILGLWDDIPLFIISMIGRSGSVVERLFRKE